MQIFMLRHGIRRLPRNLLLAMEKCGIARFLQHSYLIQALCGSFLYFTIYKTIKFSLLSSGSAHTPFTKT